LEQEQRPERGREMYRSNLAEKLSTSTEWIVLNRRTRERAFVVADTYERAAFIGMHRFKLHSIDEVNVEPHEAATSR
jgi:hypothetical protein